MIWFIVGLIAGKFITDSWLCGLVVGITLSIFIGDDDPDDPTPRGRKRTR